MRDQWYGDSRDLIKWGVLLHLATTHKINHIVQVAYMRPDRPRPDIRRGNERHSLPESVWAHFRDLDDIARLAAASGVSIDIIEWPYSPSTRLEYTRRVVASLGTRPQKPSVVFLDPDTGIAERNAKPEHVTPEEVGKLWDALEKGDWLVLYQHSHHHKDWLENKRHEFVRAIGGSTAETDTFRAESNPKDVAFYCAMKS